MIAVVIVLPLRLVYDLLAAVGRVLKRTPPWLGRLLLAAYMALLHPVVKVIGQGAALLWSGVAWLFARGVYDPLHWLVTVVVLGFLRLLGRGSGRLARWFHAVFLAPVGRLLAAVGSVLAAGLRLLGTGLGRLGTAIGMALMFLANVLLVIPAVAVWQYVLRPPLLGLAWLAKGAGAGLLWALRKLGSGIAAVWAVFAGALVWSWRMLGRLLYWVARILVVIPALALYRYLLRPVGQGVAGTWRLAGRGLRWLWRHLVVAPARAVKNGVLVPVGGGIRAVWNVSVRRPARWVRQSVLAPIRETGRDVRLQLRRAFRGG
ncbi:hypothetical protein ACFY4C_24615 [Actinomadura viridis]|uniref:hypothetical protein n=1 Tax=Actinomadura viridis TaxID=58110 RepID=UPI0036ADED7C